MSIKGPSPLRRRRLSRGLIAAGSERRPSREGNNGDSLASLPQQDDDTANTTSRETSNLPIPPSNNVGESSTSNNTTTSNNSTSNNTTTSNDNSSTIPKLIQSNDHTNLLVLSTINNSLSQGIITKYYLSNDKCRKSLLTTAKNSISKKASGVPKAGHKVRGNANKGGGYSTEEELFITEHLNTNTNKLDNDGGEYSSADEDEYDVTISYTGGGINTNTNNTNSSGGVKHLQQIIKGRTKEPYFIPTPLESSSIGLQGLPSLTSNPSSNLTSTNNNNNNTNLPFNYRKIQYFDIITASDKCTARNYLKNELREISKLRNGLLFDYLRMMQDGEKRGDSVNGGGSSSRVERERDIKQLENKCIKSEEEILSIPLSQRFSQQSINSQNQQSQNQVQKLTPGISSALLIESLSINKLESLVGMSKCYDGIVSAGLALLDLHNNNSVDSAVGREGGGVGNNSTSETTARKGNKKQLSTFEIMGALSPLLISTLSSSSGEIILALSKLRSYCGSSRYQRRFVQRISPYLVRPSNEGRDGSIWCIQHLNDVEAIVAATEMILDYAESVFSVGWYDRGQNMLNSKNTIQGTAINQLSRLNDSNNDGSGGGLVGLLSTPNHHNHHHGLLSLRRNKSGNSNKDMITNNNDSNMEEWEVIAINNGIRQSIKDVFSRDWGRIGTLNSLSKDHQNDGAAPSLSRSSRRSHHHGISTVKSKEWTTDTSSSTTTGSGGAGVTSGSSAVPAIAKSPRGPMNSKLPLSPRNMSNTSSTMAVGTAGAAQLPSAETLESTFGPSFSSQDEIDDSATATNSAETSSSNPAVEYPSAPSSPRRDNSKQQQSTPKTPPSAHYQEASRSSDNNNDRISLPNFLSDHHNHHPPSSPSRSAPLSPSSSVGGTSISSVGTARSTNNMSSSSTTREQYRALTSISTDRKRTVAACRALRAQITQFEDAFFQIHGRAPKGAAERAPLASTYMQYREWKRAIRADAACRIQALCRGARVRLLLSRSDDPAITRFVMKRRGSSMNPYSSSSSSNKPLNHLRIPLDMGGGADETTTASGGAADSLRLETRTGQRGEDDSVEVFPAPNWRNRQGRGSSGGSSQQQSSSGTSPTNAPQHSPQRSSSSRRSSSSLPDVSVMSLAELQQRKRELKQQLKLYDMNFHKQHGRMPEKREKEPIRHLYESYNQYKSQISTIEKGEARPGPGTAAFRGVTEGAAASLTPDDASPTNVTSPSQQHSSSGGDTSPNQGSHYRRSSSGGGTFNTDSIDMIASATTQDDTNTNATSSSAGVTEVASQDLTSLKAEKATLHQMLRSYEKDFFKQHKRQVSSFADIRPVAGQYRRYKEIKKAIAQKSSS